MSIARTDLSESIQVVSEDNCIVCADEVIGDPTFAYDACSFVCQRTDSIGEVCRYTDIGNTIVSSGPTSDSMINVD